MKKFLLVVFALIFSLMSAYGLELSVGLSTGYTPFSLNQNLAQSVLNDNATWLGFDADTAESAAVSTGSIPRNLFIGLTAEAKLSKLFFLQLDFNYALAIGGSRSVNDASNDPGLPGGGNVNGENIDNFSLLSVPLYFGIRRGFLKIGFGLNFTSVSYTEKGTYSDATKTVNEGQSFDRTWSGSVIGCNFLIGTEFNLSKRMIMGVDLVYLSAPLELKRDGMKNLDDTVSTIDYMSFALEGWIMKLSIRYKL